MLVSLTHLTMTNGEPVNFGMGPRTSLGAQPGISMDFDPESGLVFVSHGSDSVHVIPQSAIRQMRVSPDAIADLREFLKTRAPKRPAAGGKAA
jgi:hypothetical protein